MGTHVDVEIGHVGETGVVAGVEQVGAAGVLRVERCWGKPGDVTVSGLLTRIAQKASLLKNPVNYADCPRRRGDAWRGTKRREGARRAKTIEDDAVDRSRDRAGRGITYKG